MSDVSEETLASLATDIWRLTSDIYSHLSATIGSTRDARRAGK
jgi:hypothetical protein